jgi:hypothetical protein
MKNLKKMKKKKEKKKIESSEVKEPEVDYSGKKIIFFKSFEEMNEFDARERAELTPEENLSIVTGMRLRRYPQFNINLHPWGKKIYIDMFRIIE